MRAALLLVVALSLQPQAAGGRQTKRPAAQQRGSDSLPVSVKLLNTGKAAQETEQEDQRAAEAAQINRRQLTTNYILAGLAFLSVFLTWWTFHRTRQVTRQQLRAYVLIGDIDERGPPAPLPAAILYVFHVQNSGQTPAYDVQLRWRVTVAPAGWADPDLLPPPHERSRTTVGPGGGILFDVPPSEVTPEMLKAFQDPTYRLFIHGSIHYRDAFGTEHTTHFRRVRLPREHRLSPTLDGNQSD